MAELLRPYVEARPDEPAVTDERGAMTWRAFAARVDRLAGALRGLGLATGDAIAIHSGNRREYFELMTAAAHVGLRYVMVNWHWTADELAYVLADSGARALFSEDRFAAVVHEYYGSTGASVNTLVTTEEWLARPGTVGRPLPTVELHVLRDDGTPAGPGEPGQPWFRYTSGDDVEYWGDPAKTASIHRPDGLFTTGDIGYLDEDGYLFLADRAIDVIISGGVNIYPAEIKGVLINHPAVRDVAVFGVPDEEYGEQVKAAVELEDGYAPSDKPAAELIAFARASPAGYKAPRTVDFVPALPRTPTGKLYKRLLRDPHWAGRSRRI